MQTPPHRDHHGVDDKRAQDRSVGWRDHLRVASSDDAAGNAGREREDDMARQCPRDHLPRSPQRSPHCSHVLPRPSLAQMMTANSRKRTPARLPAAPWGILSMPPDFCATDDAEAPLLSRFLAQYPSINLEI